MVYTGLAKVPLTHFIEFIPDVNAGKKSKVELQPTFPIRAPSVQQFAHLQLAVTVGKIPEISPLSSERSSVADDGRQKKSIEPAPPFPPPTPSMIINKLISPVNVFSYKNKTTASFISNPVLADAPLGVPKE